VHLPGAEFAVVDGKKFETICFLFLIWKAGRKLVSLLHMDFQIQAGWHSLQP
jgi:hypothetical protein